MSVEHLLLLLLLFLVGAFGSALFSGCETGLYVLNRVRLKLRVEAGERSALALQGELDNSARLLVNLLIGNNMMNQLASFAAASLFALLHIGAWLEIVITAVVLTPILFVFCETLPKELFRSHSDRWTYRLAPVLRAARLLFTVTLLAPVISVLSSAVIRLTGQDRTEVAERQQERERREVGMLLKEGAGAGLLTDRQVTLLDRALSLRDLTVETEMVPWSRVVLTDADADTQTVTRQAGGNYFTRLPAIDRVGRVVGLVNTLDAHLNPQAPVRKFLEPTAHISPETTIREALRQMAQQRAAMAIVERGGKPVGIVTVKDLVEPLVGELAAW